MWAATPLSCSPNADLGPPDSFFYFDGDKEVCKDRYVLNTRPHCELSAWQFAAFVWKYAHHASISSHTINKQQAVSQHWMP